MGHGTGLFVVVVAVAGRGLPAIDAVVNQGGRDGAVDGFALLADEETLTGVSEPMATGNAYWVTAPFGALFRIAVDEEGVRISLDATSGKAAPSEAYGRKLAERVAALTGGTISAT